MNRGIRIKKNKKNLIFFLSFVFLILNIKLSNSLTILGALNKVSGKISKIKIENNRLDAMRSPFRRLRIFPSQAIVLYHVKNRRTHENAWARCSPFDTL